MLSDCNMQLSINLHIVFLMHHFDFLSEITNILKALNETFYLNPSLLQ